MRPEGLDTPEPLDKRNQDALGLARSAEHSTGQTTAPSPTKSLHNSTDQNYASPLFHPAYVPQRNLSGAVLRSLPEPAAAGHRSNRRQGNQNRVLRFWARDERFRPGGLSCRGRTSSSDPGLGT